MSQAQELFYRDIGQGFPLVLLHGNGESSEYFENQIPALRLYHRLILPDTRGHGRSPRGEGVFTLARFAEDLLTLLDALALPRVHLLGFSDGANIAMHFAIRHPERVDRLILNGGNVFPAGVKRRYQLPYELAYTATRLLRKLTKRPSPAAERLALMCEETGIHPEELALLPHKTLVLAGERDMIRREHTEMIHHLIPNSRVQFLPGTHFVARENSTVFNTAVLRFLSEP